MIVGIDGHMIGDHSGGNESYYTNILKSMEVPEGSTFILFLKTSVDDTPYRDKFKIVRFKSSSAFQRVFWELPKLCEKYHLDLIHLQYFIPFHRPCPVVTTIHDISFEHYKDIFTRIEYLRQKILIPYAAKKSARIITVSENAKQDIVKMYHVPAEKIIVTGNAVNSRFRKLSSIELKEMQLREKFSIGAGPYILTVGNLQPRKNLPRLIEAFRRFQVEHTEYRLVIVGKKAWMYDGVLKAAASNVWEDDAASYRSAERKQGNSSDNSILLTDYVSDEDLVRLYNAASFFVYPSFFEGFGIPPLEAMACGIPVAVSCASSLPEVVGDAGLYFDPFNTSDIVASLDRLATDEIIRQQLIIRGYERVNKFSWIDSAKNVVNTYKKVAETVADK